MINILLLYLMLAMNSVYASSCLPEPVPAEEYSKFNFIKNCDAKNSCADYDKWDFIYFSKKIFGYSDDLPFYIIKEEKYLKNHCLGVITGEQKFFYHYSDKTWTKVVPKTVVLLNRSCPKPNETVYGNLIYQIVPSYYPSYGCGKPGGVIYTGRAYLKLKNGYSL